MTCLHVTLEFWFDFKFQASSPFKFLFSLGAENQAELIEESIQYARKAITLDVNYGISWCKQFDFEKA